MRVAIDTSVPVYAVGSDSPFKDSCRQLIQLAGTGDVVLEASVEVIQEFLHVRARRTGDRLVAANAARALADVVRLHEVEEADTRRAIDLFARHSPLDALDAIHAATCLNRGISTLISADRAFDDLPDLRRVDPRDAQALLLS